MNDEWTSRITYLISKRLSSPEEVRALREYLRDMVFQMLCTSKDPISLSIADILSWATFEIDWDCLERTYAPAEAD